MDVRISFPDQGLIQVEGAVFADADSEACRTFIRCAFAVAEIDDVRLHGGRSPRAELRFTAARACGRTIVDRLAKLLARARVNREAVAEVQLPLIARDRPETLLATKARERLGMIAGKEDVSDNPFPTLTAFLNPDSLKEAELDAMAESEELIARENDAASGIVR